MLLKTDKTMSTQVTEYIHKWIVGKAGGGVLRTKEDIYKLYDLVKIYHINVLIVSAFPGQTRLLETIIQARDADLFNTFLDYHRNYCKELHLRLDFYNFFKDLIDTFKYQYALLSSSERDSPDEDAARASILALGEDFSKRIIGEFFKNKLPRKKKLVLVDARSMVVTEDGEFVSVDIDQVASKPRILEHLNPARETLYLVQGFVGSVRGEKSQTSVLHLDGSDVTAALVASCLGSKDHPAELIYFKTSRGSEDRISKPMIGISLFVKYMEDTGRTVVSPRIQLVDDLPPYFMVVNCENDNFNFRVMLTAEMVEKWRKVHAENLTNNFNRP